MNNEEKILSILEKLVSEFAELKTDVAELKTDVAALKTDVAELKAEVAAINETVIRIENDHGERLSALFDGYALGEEKNVYLEPRVIAIESELASLSVKLRYIMADMKHPPRSSFVKR